MFSKSNLISTLVTAVWGYFGGWLLWGMLVDPMLTDHSSANLMREMPDMVHLIIGCIIVGFTVSTIYSKWANGTFSLTTGLSFGVWIGILFGFGNGVVDFAVMDLLDLTGTLINGVTYIVFYAIMGLFAGLVYQKTSPA